MKVLETREMPASQSLFLLLGIFILGYIIGNIIGAVAMIGIGLDDFSFASLATVQEKLMSSKKGWWAMLIGQGVGSLFIFAVPALFYWFIFEKKSLLDLNFKNTPLTTKLFLITVLTTLFSIPFIGWSAKINEQMHLPAAFSELEKMMKILETKAADLTKFLVSFTAVSEYIASIIVIAFIAGIGEELFFRGLLQRKLWYGTGNIHVAIWISAIIFSAIHFQFFGFLPRMILGALFGYMYYWSGNILVPIIGHIFNNGLSVTLMYASNNKLTDLNMENSNDITLPIAAFSVLLTTAAIYFFYRELQPKTIES